ncbi:unnamed protein product [Didymodactylos carnosus]|uniref:Uncharacterized protein n=1 Tax=Didymodactylos carnosus TaxID=1234261 RepID=A0A814ER33_9BILA|nr:unnamed protein product [Didymodactylos carnosus]CAF0970879.1 unnamed protein product [Didymodactylos carnosus]CAF3688495.1 unnamed protein product [Didymodactylos carnosus]CAF3743943.1 unnamed protein product [Didymodactylos carnosus]
MSVRCITKIAPAHGELEQLTDEKPVILVPVQVAKTPEKTLNNNGIVRGLFVHKSEVCWHDPSFISSLCENNDNELCRFIILKPFYSNLQYLLLNVFQVSIAPIIEEYVALLVYISHHNTGRLTKINTTNCIVMSEHFSIYKHGLEVSVQHDYSERLCQRFSRIFVNQITNVFKRSNTNTNVVRNLANFMILLNEELKENVFNIQSFAKYQHFKLQLKHAFRKSQQDKRLQQQQEQNDNQDNNVQTAEPIHSWPPVTMSSNICAAVTQPKIIMTGLEEDEWLQRSQNSYNQQI